MSAGSQNLTSTIVSEGKELLLGFLPGYDAYKAFTDQNVTTLDNVAGVAGIVPGAGKLLGLV